MKKLLFLIFIFPLVSLAQESDLGNWLIYIGDKKINDKWDIHHEVQYRNYNAIGDLEQLLLRGGIGYTFNERKNNVLLGYGFIRSENYNPLDEENKLIVNEHRVFQQFISKQKINRVKLTHRYRFEQRFVEDIFKMRGRYFLSINIPLNPKDQEKQNLYLSIYDELFINTDPGLFDRNRIFGGLGYRFNEKVRVELGYMSQVFEYGFRDQVNVLIFANF